MQMALQPIVDINRNTWVNAEALARFPDGRGPDLWFAEAQASGLATELELLAIDKAIALLPALPDDVGVSINASPTMILDPRFRQTLGALGPGLQRITVEITEHSAVSAYDDINEALVGLRENGMRLAVDDTGAGYASFTHVLRLRPDSIELDRTLITDIGTDAAGAHSSPPSCFSRSSLATSRSSPLRRWLSDPLSVMSRRPGTSCAGSDR